MSHTEVSGTPGVVMEQDTRMDRLGRLAPRFLVMEHTFPTQHRFMTILFHLMA